MSKKRVIKSYEKLTEEQLAYLQELYPTGYSDKIIYYTDREGKLVPAIPMETEDTYYMVKLPVQAVVVEEEVEGAEGNAQNSAASGGGEDGDDLRSYTSAEGGINYIPIGGTNEDFEAIERGEDPDY